MAKENVTLRRGITRGGVIHEAGDNIEVQDWEKRQLIADGYVDGEDIDTAPTEELKEQYKEAAKGWENRSDMDVFSIEKAAEEGDGYGDPAEAEADNSASEADSPPSEAQEDQSNKSGNA